MTKLFSKPKALLGITLVLCMILSMLPLGIFSVSADTTWGGTGDANDPYQISTADQLALLATNVNAGTTYSGNHFKLMNNIDLGGNAWTPIGGAAGGTSKKFMGHFDGNGFTIAGLSVSGTARYVGFFGYVQEGSISNLTVQGTVTSSGNSVGGIVGGWQDGATMTNCAFIGTVTTTGFQTGGLIGTAPQGATIKNCYTAGGIVRGSSSGSVAGLVGTAANASTTLVVENCYSTMTVSCTAESTGGLVGGAASAAAVTINNVFFAGTMDGTNNPIAGTATAGATVTNAYYKTDSITGEASGVLTNVTAYTAAQFKDGTVLAKLTANSICWAQGTDHPVLRVVDTWNGSSVATAFAGGSGSQADPYQIKTGAQLKLFANNVNAGTTYSGNYFKLMNDIDLGGKAWTPIGGLKGSSPPSFWGHFDGNGFTIAGLNVSGTTARYAGFFGYITAGSVSNLTVKGSVASKANSVGGIVGCIQDGGTLTNCAFIGSVSSTGVQVGGLVGTVPQGTTITNCYAIGGTVSGTGTVGGLAGTVGTTLTVNNCYSDMTVTCSATASTGGLFGGVPAGVTMTNAFFVGTVTATDGAPISGNVPASSTLTKVYYKTESITGTAAGLLTDVTAYAAGKFADGTVTDALGSGWATSKKAGYPVHSTFTATTNALVDVGTSIRTSTPNGIRFHFKVNETAQTSNLLECGVVVAKAANTANGLYIGSTGSAYLPAIKGNFKQFVRENIADDDGVYDYFTARVDFSKNDPASYEIEYSARAYAVYEDADGQEIIIYSNLIDDAYNNSLYTVAKMALSVADQTGYSESELAHLNEIVNAVEG